MSITQTNTMAKVAAVVAGLGLVAMTFVAAAPAKAADTMFNVNLTVGSRGADVSALQAWLIAGGYSIPAGATGYFGAQTKAAVAAYQAAKGISPAVGYFGPLTRASVNAGGSTTGGSTQAGCGAGNVYSSTTGQLCSTGGSTSVTGNGRFTGVSSLGDITSDLKEGDSATQVIGVEADATDGDVQVQRLDVKFTIANSGGSSNLDRYVGTVAVYLDGAKLGTMDAADGDKDGRVWTFRFSNLNGVVKAGKTGQLYVKVTPISSIGSDESGDTVTANLAVDSLRAVGGDGISDTYIATAIDQDFTVSSATDGTLTVSAGSDNPKASQIAVASSTTTGVTLLTFSMKAKNQDVTVNDLAIQLGTSDSLSDVVSTVKLMKGSTVLKTKTVSSGTFGTTTFDGIDRTISKDSTETYSVVVDLKGDSAYADGTTLIASTTTYGWDVSDANGATVTPSASAAGNTMTLTATGISVAKGSITTSTTVGLTGAGDSTQYTIPFTVTAGDTDIYIGGSVTRVASATTVPSASAGGATFATTTSSTASSTGTATTNFSAADSVSGDSAGSYYKISANTSRVFTLNVSFTATATGYTGVELVGVNYGPTSTLGTTYYTSNLDTFKTADIRMQTR
ncbi:MAG: peptidoglycan-binding protein [Patescibacteria group bacterium]